MNDIKRWLGKHPNVVIVIIVSLTVLLLAAMFFGLDLSWIPYLLEHAYTHLPSGNDALLIVGRAFLPLMARPSNPLALTVTVGAGFYRYLGTETSFTETVSSSFSSYLPAAGMQTFVVLSLNRSTNALAITASGVNAVAADAVPFTAAQALTVVAGVV